MEIFPQHTPTALLYLFELAWKKVPKKNNTATNIVGKLKKEKDIELLAHIAEAAVPADECPAETETTAAPLRLHWMMHNIFLHKALSFNFHIFYPLLT